jgi:hypothetical protein
VRWHRGQKTRKATLGPPDGDVWCKSDSQWMQHLKDVHLHKCPPIQVPTCRCPLTRCPSAQISACTDAHLHTCPLQGAHLYRCPPARCHSHGRQELQQPKALGRSFPGCVKSLRNQQVWEEVSQSSAVLEAQAAHPPPRKIDVGSVLPSPACPSTTDLSWAGLRPQRT